jgi:hypothetical protein
MQRERLGNRIAASLAFLALAACAQQSPYFGPKQPGESVGYTDTRLGQNRYRVTYSGNSATDRETVENFLLVRAAQVTLASGYSHFLFDTRDTKAKTSYFSSFTGWPGWDGYGGYWHSWDFGPPFDVQGESRPITRFEAYAEIVMLTPMQAAKELKAIDAHEIIARLGPGVLPPPGKP